MKLMPSLSFLLLLFLAWTAAASDITEVVTSSPAWETFTNKDGSGLYHEVLREVFALHDLPVRHEYAISNRSEELVRLNNADMMTCDDRTSPPLVLARYPLYVNDFHAFFSKARIGPWKGVQTLWGKDVLIQPGYYTQENFSVPVNLREVLTGTQAVSMILLGRADFYVDDLTLIKASLKENTNAYQEEDFAIEKVGSRAYYPIFNTTERGKLLRRMYEEGMLTLYKAGKLQPIYAKWGYQCPDLKAY
ncbi:MAG: transporter substrate-binding domain-containing protein [Pseudodesulfovibrio sp.]